MADVVRDQTEPRSPADFTRAQLALLETEVRRHRGIEVFPASRVRAALGKAAGALEGLEDRAGLVGQLQHERDQMRAELEEARGNGDPEALALWRGRYMADAQEAAEGVYGQAVERANQLVADARRRAAGIIEEAQRRAARTMNASPDGLPVRPDLPGDGIEAVLVWAQYLDGMRSWLSEQDAELDEALDAQERRLAEARALRSRAVT